MCAAAHGELPMRTPSAPPPPAIPQPSAHLDPPAVVFKTLFEAPPLLFGGLPAAQTSPLQREAWETQAPASARVGPAPGMHAVRPRWEAAAPALHRDWLAAVCVLCGPREGSGVCVPPFR